ncbi:DUF3592 domain-containing protein [Streptomyces sp. NPDC093260]|uniref:DUF3592 domain-containing protein n=1 Tax=Streptomyces sp. NPDC093260 TaxID=3155073 RepID=UPI003449A9FE
MEALFYAVPSLMIAFAVLALVTATRRARRVRDAWDGGLTAEARCLRTYTTNSGGGNTSARTTLHHVYAFRTREGREVRFEETDGPGTTVEGDIVTVHYRAERPEHATAHAPARRGRLAVEQGCVFAFLGVFIVACLVFVAVVHTLFSEGDPMP